jgi:hypothetical protein
MVYTTGQVIFTFATSGVSRHLLQMREDMFKGQWGIKLMQRCPDDLLYSYFWMNLLKALQNLPQ